jgi:hypothetical protein
MGNLKRTDDSATGPGTTAKGPNRRAALPWLGAAGLLLLLGCAGENRRGPDPLRGDSGAGASVVPPPVPVPVTPVPPAVPVTGGVTPSVAALASGAPAPLPGALPLGITDTSTAQGAALRQPEPVPIVPVSRSSPAPVAISTPKKTGAVTTFEQAQAVLEARGVVWQQAEGVKQTGDWKFSCSLANPKNPKSLRTYEAHAGSYLAAVQAVLDKIDQDGQ